MVELARASVDLDLDTDKFEKELREALKEIKDLKATVHPTLEKGAKKKLEDQLKGLEAKVTVHPTLVGSNARRKLQAELNALTPRFTIKVTPIIDKSKVRDELQSELNSIENLGVRVNAFETTDLTAKEGAAVQRLERIRQGLLRTQQQQIKLAQELKRIASQTADIEQKSLRQKEALLREQLKTEREHVALEERLLTSQNKALQETEKVQQQVLRTAQQLQKLSDQQISAEQKALRDAEALNQQKIQTAIKLKRFSQQQIDSEQKALRDAQALLAAESRTRAANNREALTELRLATGIVQEHERKNKLLEEQRKKQFSITNSFRQLLAHATQLNRIKFDNINELLGKSVAGEAFLTTLGNIFKSALNLRKTALQLGAAFTTAFAAGALGAGALISAISTAISGLGVLAGLGIITVGVKFLMEDAEVKAAADRAAATYKEVMTRAALSLKPVLVDFFNDFSESIKKQEKSLTSFFDKVTPAVNKLGDDFNKLLASEKVGKLIEGLGDSTAAFLNKIDLNAIFDGAVKISEAFKQAKKDIREAFGPSIFSGITVDGFIRGLQRLTRALVSAGDGVKAFKKAFGEAFEGVKLGLEDVLRTVGEFGPEVFGALGPIAKQVAQDVGQVISSLIRFSSVVLPQAKDELIEFSDVFSDNLSDALDILAKPFGKTLESAAELGTLLSPLLPIFARIAAALEPILGTILEIGKILAPIAESFFAQLADILEDIKPTLEFIEGKVKSLREFLEKHPGVSNFLGRTAAIVAALVLGFLLLRKVIRGILGLGRGIAEFGRKLKNAFNILDKLKNKKVKVDVESDAEKEVRKALDKIKQLDKELAKKRSIDLTIDVDGLQKALADIDRLDKAIKNLKNARVSVDVDIDDANKIQDLQKALNSLKDKNINIDVDTDARREIQQCLNEIQKLDQAISKKRVIHIECEKTGDCECDDDDGIDLDRRRRRRRAPRTPKTPKIPPIPPGTVQSYDQLDDALKRIERSAEGATKKAGPLSRALGGLGRAIGPVTLGLGLLDAGLRAGSDNLDTLRKHAESMPGKLDALKQKLEEANGPLEKFGIAAGFAATELFNLGKEIAGNTLKGLNDAFNDFTGIDINGLIQSIKNAIVNGDWSSLAETLKSTIGNILNNFVFPFIPIDVTGLADSIGRAIAGIDWGKAFSGVKERISNFFKDLFGGEGGGFGIPTPKVPTPDISGLEGALETGKRKIQEFKDALRSLFTIEGTAVPSDTPLAAFGSIGGSGGGGGGFSGITSQVDALVQRLNTAKTEIETAGLGIRTAIQDIFTGLDLATPLATLGNAITTGITAAFTQGFSTLGSTISTSVTDAMAQAVPAAQTGLDAVKTVVDSNVTAIGEQFNILKTSIPAAIQAAMTAAVETAVIGMNALLQAIANIVGQITALSSQFYNAGAILGQSFADGLRSKISEAQQAGADVAGAAAGNFNASPAKYGPLAGKGDAFYRGQEFVNRLIRGLLDKEPELREFAGRLAGALDQFRNSDLGKFIEAEFKRLRSQISVEFGFGRGLQGFGFGGGGVIGGTQQLTGPGGRNSGRILRYDTQAQISNGNRSGSILQIRPGAINVSLTGVNDPREFINSLSRELVTYCTAR